MISEGDKRTLYKSTLQRGSEKDYRNIQARELGMWHSVRNQTAKYAEVKRKEQQSETLTTQDAALLATFEGYALQMYLSSLTFNPVMPEEAIRRTGAFYRQYTFLRTTGLIRPVNSTSKVLLLGAGGIITDAFPLVKKIKSLDPKKLVEYDNELTAAAENTFNKPNPDYTEVYELMNGFPTSGVASIQTVKPAITAVDTDEFRVTEGAKIADYFEIPVVPEWTTGREFLEREDKPSFDLIAGIRMDPRLIDARPGNFLSLVDSRLKPYGQALFTMGEGASPLQRIERENLFFRMGSMWTAGGKSATIQANKNTPGCELWTDGMYMDIATLTLS